MSWEDLYNFFGIKEFIYFISSPQIQESLLPIKVIFIFFSIFFLFFVIYFMINSSWLQYKFLEDVTEFFSWQAYGQRQMQKQWEKIRKRVESGSEADYKLSIIDADDYLAEVLDSRGYEGKDFQEAIQRAGRLIGSTLDDVIKAHEVRNLIVYNPDYKLSVVEAKKILSTYQIAINSIGLS